MSSFTSQDQLSINTIRALAADVVGKANSGHPGMCIPASNSLELSSFALCIFQELPWAWPPLPTSSSLGSTHYARLGQLANGDLHPRFFNANPKNSKWFNRDRFVLSNGCVAIP